MGERRADFRLAAVVPDQREWVADFIGFKRCDNADIDLERASAASPAQIVHPPIAKPDIGRARLACVRIEYAAGLRISRVTRRTSG